MLVVKFIYRYRLLFVSCVRAAVCAREQKQILHRTWRCMLNFLLLYLLLQNGFRN